MADASVGFLLDNLKELLLYSADLIGEAKTQVEELDARLALFKGFIKDCAEQPTQNHVVQGLVQNIRDVVARAEDAIDKFVVEKAKHKAPPPPPPSPPPPSPPL